MVVKLTLVLTGGALGALASQAENRPTIVTSGNPSGGMAASSARRFAVVRQRPFLDGA